jgi:hypothetical protein
MEKLLLGTAFAALLLSACNKPADTAAPQTPVAAAATADLPAAPAESVAAQPVPGTAVPAAANAPVANSDADMDKAIDDALGDHATYRKVMEDFQKAVAAKDATAASLLVHYPIGVEIAGKNTVLRNASAFVKEYDRFMTPDIAKAIVDTRYADAFVNYKGVMLGRGEAWINGICNDNACKDVDVKVVTLQSTSDLSP